MEIYLNYCLENGEDKSELRDAEYKIYKYKWKELLLIIGYDVIFDAGGEEPFWRYEEVKHIYEVLDRINKSPQSFYWYLPNDDFNKGMNEKISQLINMKEDIEVLHCYFKLLVEKKGYIHLC